MAELTRKINVPQNASLSERQYKEFIEKAFQVFAKCPNYLAPDEDINSLELAHLIPSVPETVLAIYVGINDAVCNKGLVTPYLVRHGHNNVFVFDPQIYSGGTDVPKGTLDARQILKGFEPPNNSWNPNWTYAMIGDPDRTFQSLWKEKGYIDMIPAKFEDFTILTDSSISKVCVFIDKKAFDHPVNAGRKYLRPACRQGEKHAHEFEIPKPLQDETAELIPVILEKGQKLFVATADFAPCAHAWSNIHPDNKELAVINENSAVPLDLVIAKPPVKPQYAEKLVPAKGSADLTTDWFYRGQEILRSPLLQGLFKG